MSARKPRPEALKARETLRRYIPTTETPVWYVDISRMGSTQRVRLLVVDERLDIHDVTLLACRATGMRWHDKQGALAVPGVGLSGGEHAVARLAQALEYHRLPARRV